MPLAIGAEVVVGTLARKRGVIVEATPDGRYRVRVENVIVWCREGDLESPPQTSKKKRGRRNDGGAAPSATSSNPGDTAMRVDLHGLTVDEAVARLTSEIDRAILRGAERLDVVHGKGSGRVKHAVHRYLATLTVVAAFNEDPQNAGVTWVYF